MFLRFLALHYTPHQHPSPTHNKHEEGGSMFLQTIKVTNRNKGRWHRKRQKYKWWLLHAWSNSLLYITATWSRLLQGGTWQQTCRSIQNLAAIIHIGHFNIHKQDHITQQPRRSQSELTLPWESLILMCTYFLHPDVAPTRARGSELDPHSWTKCWRLLHHPAVCHSDPSPVSQKQPLLLPSTTYSPNKLSCSLLLWKLTTYHLPLKPEHWVTSIQFTF